MRSTLEKWRTYVAQSQKYARSLKRQQEEIASLREQAMRAHTLESRMALQAEAVLLLYEEAALHKARSEELAGQLLEKGSEMDALVCFLFLFLFLFLFFQFWADLFIFFRLRK
jgi:hypothetical protein